MQVTMTSCGLLLAVGAEGTTTPIGGLPMTEQFGEENILALTEALALRKAAGGTIKVNALLDD